ncbi:MAG: acylphosphatase [Candidatus Nealsonbacteria bacterium CG10_big_fil_rev_8_21_14_0_10_36_24]|uniref:Acylphosphatase n=2 Tax=Candidatus Nealsoniibacteriota TaxID=1817911 RepID=A0A2H0YQT0_9BACT|nr:MAG: acylphosphatase [Candidatus Nealsonbacteria bacterium CG10_big_fil_rev_8_21_14_0_10_36_24]PIS40102.1 MAG: acylphosphatase [Candidatus Nealsonbacteria bacterium CG08_land_8_20_14_0_20_36_22]
MNPVRVHIFVSGRVQGVFFRTETQKKAERLEITGFVRNLPDGRVEAILEGEKEKVEKVIEWARKGPFFAKVKNVEIINGNYKGEFKEFNIIY